MATYFVSFFLFVSALPARSASYQLLPNVQYYVAGPSRDWLLDVLLDVSISPPKISSPPSSSGPFSSFKLYVIEKGQVVFMDCESNSGADCGKLYASTTYGHFSIAPDPDKHLGLLLNRTIPFDRQPNLVSCGPAYAAFSLAA